MELSPKNKCLIRYLFDNCDCSGVWTPNWKLASLHIGEIVDKDDLITLPEEQFEVLETGKIFLPDFINFQYGKLSELSPAHKPVFSAIQKNNLSDRVFNRVLSRVSDTLQEKDIYKEKEKDIKKGGEGENKNWNSKPGETELEISLPEIKAGAVIQLFHFSKGVAIDTEQVYQLWGVFKKQNFTGKKFYDDANAVYSHFINWTKSQNINNGTNSQSTKNGGKSNGSAEVIAERLAGKLASRGKANP